MKMFIIKPHVNASLDASERLRSLWGEFRWVGGWILASQIPNAIAFLEIDGSQLQGLFRGYF